MAWGVRDQARHSTCMQSPLPSSPCCWSHTFSARCSCGLRRCKVEGMDKKQQAAAREQAEKAAEKAGRGKRPRLETSVSLPSKRPRNDDSEGED